MTKLNDVNTTDIADAISLGCRNMANSLNADDGSIPYGGASVRPEAGLGGSSEAHSPGRHLNAVLNAENAAGIELDEDYIDKLAESAYFSYSQAPLPLHRVGDKVDRQGTPIELQDHDLREGFHALYSLTKYRDSSRARELAEQSIKIIIDYWLPTEQWEIERIESNLPVKIMKTGYSTYIQRVARSIGPLVKFYKASGYGPALQLAEVLKEKAIREFFMEDGAFSTELFGTHAHSTTCVMSSLAQLADLTRDSSLMNRVKAFYDNGLWEMRDQIGWSIEGTHIKDNCGRGEANNTGDIVETALILGRWGYPDYFADAERIVRSHLLPSQLRDVSFIVEPDNPDNKDGKNDVAKRLQGAFGFPAQYGHEPSGIWESDKPRIGFNLDIVGGAVASLCEVYREVTRYDSAGHWVTMLFDHETPEISVQSPYTHDRLAVQVKKPGVLHVRIPPWIGSNDYGKELNVAGPAGVPRISNGYLVFSDPGLGDWITFDFELPEYDMTLKWREEETRARFRGDQVIAMENFGTDLTFFDPI